jgi:5-methyltetrahydrofolate--homocysteine methyltransferase
VAGSIGPSGKLPSMDDPELSNVSFDELADIFREQARGLIEGGVDVLLIETSQDILEVKAAIIGIHAAFEETGLLPIQAQVTLDTTGRMLLGTDIAAVLTILEGMGIDAIGLNCSTGPDYMREPIRILGEQSPCRSRASPTPACRSTSMAGGLPARAAAVCRYADRILSRSSTSTSWAAAAAPPPSTWQAAGGTGARAASRTPAPTNSPPRLASATQAINMQQEPAPFLIGERSTRRAAQKFKKLILAKILKRSCRSPGSRSTAARTGWTCAWR